MRVGYKRSRDDDAIGEGDEGPRVVEWANAPANPAPSPDETHARRLNRVARLVARLQRKDGNGSMGYDQDAPPPDPGRGQAFPRGLSPRRLRRETMLPGRQRIPRTTATSSVPPSSVGTRAAALPVPWL